MALTPQERRERNRAYQRRWRERNPDKAREYYLKHREARLDDMRRYYRKDPKNYVKKRIRYLERQAGRPKPDSCEICGENGVRITFDHCHQRDLFRGWICQSCNAILGLARDSPDRLRKLIAYLERTKDLIAPQLELPV